MPALVVGILALGLYIFIIPYQFVIKFKAKTTPGDIIQTIRLWDRKYMNYTVVKIDSVNKLYQRIKLDKSDYFFTWRFELDSDSITHVRVEVSEPSNSIKNKLLVPFTKTKMEEDSEILVKEFYDVLNSHLEITKVTIEGENENINSFCACRNLKTAQIDKAQGMMKDYDVLTSFVSEFDLTLDGPPIVRVEKWNHEKGTLEFDFCFPIVQTDSLPKVKEIDYKLIKKTKALKAIYYGNYITSDRAWYALVNFANRNNYKVDGLPIEYFHSNPTLGANQQDWKAEVYLPIE
ncbi:hypothetical protein C900_02563 [Fulvivirga imtechensis AK7]|uniref:GyrI-like small molecule binding domain-containing protein n=2 Tax=Fulvivirga TaxID=396811 RepID=L8JRL0_9BACT|nr:hypothetical protein C900_02563 [Fulvivirga imtechensis AK7]